MTYALSYRCDVSCLLQLAVMHGLAMEVTVDWNSVDTVPDLDTQRHLLNLLAGEHGSSQLAGLVAVVESCMHLLQDMALLVNRRSAEDAKAALSHTKHIVVTYVKDLPVARGNLELPLESRIVWFFSLDQEGSLVYNTNTFPLYTFTNVAHTLFTCLAPALRRFPDPPSTAWRSSFTPDPEIRMDTPETVHAGSDGQQSVTDEGKSTGGTTVDLATNASEVGGTTAPSDVTGDAFWSMESPGEDMSRLAPSPGETRNSASPLLKGVQRKRFVKLVEVDDSGVVLDISWDSFAFLPEVKRLLNFIRTAMSQEFDRVSESYAALQPLDLNVRTVAIRTVFGQEGAGLALDNYTLTLTFHCFSQLDGTWGVGPIDSDSFFFEKRTQYLCGRWRTGSMHMSASLDRTTRHLTRALGFPVSLPVASQTTFELLCRVESKQLTHPHKLLKLFLKSLSRHVTDGYVQAVTTALSFSGHCWLVGRADVPSTMWCWVRMADVAKRKPGERYLVLTRTPHGKSLFHTMRGSDVLQAAPGALGGVWHRHDHAVEGTSGVVMKEVITDRTQFVTVNGHVFFTTQSRATAKFMSSLPLSVEIGMGTESPLTKALWFDDVFLRPLELGDRTQPLACTNASSSAMMECWQLASSIGFHLVFDLLGFGAENAALRDQRCLMSSQLMLETLRDITDASLSGADVVQTVKRFLSTLGTVTVSHKLVDRALHITRGGVYNEEVNIYLLTERDLHLAPLASVWDRPEGLGWPKPFTETLRCALCVSFALQTRSDLSSLFNKKLSRNIPVADISFFDFAERSDKLLILAMSHEAVAAFFAALTHFMERYLSGMRKLKADLTSVIFLEEVAAGPVVSLHAGILTVGLFKVSPQLGSAVKSKHAFV